MNNILYAIGDFFSCISVILTLIPGFFAGIATAFYNTANIILNADNNNDDNDEQ